MNEKKQDAGSSRGELEQIVKRRFAGMVLALVTIVPLLSLISYDWRDVSALRVPVLTPCANLFGEFGAWLVFDGYCVLGLAFWLVPLLMLAAAAALIFAPAIRLRWRIVWSLMFLICVSGLFQLGSTGCFASVLSDLNIAPNAGGASGFFIATRLMARWFSPFGGGIFMVLGALFCAVMLIGPREIFKLATKVAGMFRERLEREHLADEAEAAASDDGLTEKERRRLAREAEKEAIRKAREEAKKAREAERAAEKERKRREAAEREEAKNAATDAMTLQAEKIQRLRQKQEEARRRMQEERNAPPRPEPVAAVRRSEAAVPPPPAPAVSVAAAPAAVPASAPPSPVPPAAGQEGCVVPLSQEYPLPSVDLLNPVPDISAEHGDVHEMGQQLVETLRQFNVEAEIVGIKSGPVVTQYELRPGAAVRVANIKGLSDNLQMALAAKSLRIEAPIPGKSAVGIEVPNLKTVPVLFRELMESSEWNHAMRNAELPMALGKDVAGNVLIADLAKAPHLLVAGSTGSGKSVCLNTIITGFLMSRAPDRLRLILVDPKRVEFATYNDLPQLLVPVINDSRKVAFTLRWAIVEMERRYKLLQKHKCRNIVGYNNRPAETQGDLFGGVAAAGQGVEPDPDKLPYIVIIIDEVADIMAEVGKDIEMPISRLCAKSRAVGIHLILATQRPSVDVITGTIKSNIPGRIAFKVSQGNDSRTILDSPGAEDLLGRGDMLYLKEGSVLMRAQGAYLDDQEIERVVDFVKGHCRPCYDSSLCSRMDSIRESNGEEELLNGDGDSQGASSDSDAQSGGDDDGDEATIRKALEVIRNTNRASISHLQRRLGIGYNKAARVIDALEERKILGPAMGAGPRDILVDLEAMLSEEPAVATDAAGDVLPPEGDDGIAPGAIPPPDGDFGDRI